MSSPVAEVEIEQPAPEPEPEPLPEGTPTEPETNDADVEPAADLSTTAIDGQIEVRDLAKREIGIRIVPWDTVVSTPQGAEEFKRGAFAGTDPGRVVLRMDHQNPAAGRGLTLEERADAAYMTFKVSQTARGDEILTLAMDGVVTGASIGFQEVQGGTAVETRKGRRVRVHRRAGLREVSTTWLPTYERAAVEYVRSAESNTGVTSMTEAAEAPVAGADNDRILAAFQAIEQRAAAQQAVHEKFMERLEKLETRERQDITVPSTTSEDRTPSKSEWAETVIKLLTGDRVPDLQMRDLANVITTDNAGVVPPTYLTELIGVIDTSRPFLSTTRRLPTPATGMDLKVPVITQRPITGVQSAEKTEVASQKTIIGVETFSAITIAGAGDLSLQVLKRSSRDFLDLWLELLAEAYAIDAEDEAIHALTDAIGGVGGASALDPEGLSLGDAFVASFDAIRRPPDTIWLSTQAVGEFIDAKATTTNQPLYPGLRASATAAGGIEGVISGLRPVHVPTLDNHGAFAIVGPSNGFAWAEDGTYTLQVDVPAKAGRDVALVGMLWLAPWYPAAFTAYNVAS